MKRREMIGTFQDLQFRVTRVCYVEKAERMGKRNRLLVPAQFLALLGQGLIGAFKTQLALSLSFLLTFKTFQVSLSCFL